MADERKFIGIEPDVSSKNSGTKFNNWYESNRNLPLISSTILSSLVICSPVNSIFELKKTPSPEKFTKLGSTFIFILRLFNT